MSATTISKRLGAQPATPPTAGSRATPAKPPRQTIYLERGVREHSRSQAIIRHFAKPCLIECDSYQEVFNPKRNDFRLQKQHPALIIARKPGGYLQPSPYGLGGVHNFYFSHMLNCIYDCSYCFLQALYAAAHYVLFVNYEDFFQAIENQLASLPGEDVYFFSGYDCDSLAYEPVSKFLSSALPFFAQRPRAYLELRTKSVQLRTLLRQSPFANCIVAFSLSSEELAAEYEQGVPSIGQRLAAMNKLALAGWRLGARLDPLLWSENWQAGYAKLISQLAAAVPAAAMHSITLGSLRFPRALAATMRRHYPGAKFLAAKLITTDAALEFRAEIQQELLDFCQRELMRYYPQELIVKQVL